MFKRSQLMTLWKTRYEKMTTFWIEFRRSVPMFVELMPESVEPREVLVTANDIPGPSYSILHGEKPYNTTKPRYNEQYFASHLAFVISRFHCFAFLLGSWIFILLHFWRMSEVLYATMVDIPLVWNEFCSTRVLINEVNFFVYFS